MCLLSVASPGATQDVDELMTACAHNPDGFGYAVHAGDRIVTGRGMVAAKVVHRYLAERARFDSGPALFHARLATHGAENVANCHPFRVGGDRRIVLAHNGILPIGMAKDDRRSDTRVYAEDVLPRLGVRALDDPEWTRATEHWLGPNKIAVLSASPTLARPLYLLNEHQGAWDDGIWWSNDSYCERPPHPGWYEAELGDRCEVCGGALSALSLMSEVCEVCASCLWCSVTVADCLCYVPARSSVAHADATWWAGHTVDAEDPGEVTAVP